MTGKSSFTPVTLNEKAPRRSRGFFWFIREFRGVLAWARSLSEETERQRTFAGKMAPKKVL